MTKSVDQEEKVRDVETVKDFSYLGDRIYSGGGIEAAETSRTRKGRAKFREDAKIYFSGKISSENQRN